MLDRWSLPLIKKPLCQIARVFKNLGVSANQVTLGGFLIGLLAIPALFSEHYNIALVLIILNRILDGVDGELARLTAPTDQGAFLDIVLDFIFYSAVIFGFALANPTENSLAASALIFAFICTGVSFLAFSIMADRRDLKNIDYPNKGIYYISGLAEGTETIIFYILICLFPQNFVELAWGFAAICYLSAALRTWSGYQTLKDDHVIDPTK